MKTGVYFLTVLAVCALYVGCGDKTETSTVDPVVQEELRSYINNTELNDALSDLEEVYTRVKSENSQWQSYKHSSQEQPIRAFLSKKMNKIGTTTRNIKPTAPGLKETHEKLNKLMGRLRLIVAAENPLIEVDLLLNQVPSMLIGYKNRILHHGKMNGLEQETINFSKVIPQLK